MAWPPEKTPRDPNSQNYRKVVKHGCGGSRDYWGEFDCDHLYEWSCDECPIVDNMYRTKQPEKKEEDGDFEFQL